MESLALWCERSGAAEMVWRAKDISRRRVAEIAS